MEPRRIADYALIGDCRSAALVSRDGSVDWLCWPRFDSPPLFGALLDDERGGSWRLGPCAPATVERRYRPGTNVLETTFVTDTGVLEVVDFMPVPTTLEEETELLPEDDLVRIARCREGVVDVEVRYRPRPRLGRGACRLVDHGGFGVRVEGAVDTPTLMSEVPLTLDEPGVARARFRLRQGEVARFHLAFLDEGPGVLPLVGEELDRRREATEAWWRAWSSRLRYRGRWPKRVERSALALKLLQFAPSGAIIAAPTTSLPERMGGDLNWDYRYCWARDASFTTRALFGLGFVDEGLAFVSWLLHATHGGNGKRLRVLYDVYGRAAPPERLARDVAGFRGSRPVRFGNLARRQLQLDVYGEVIGSALELTRRGGGLDRDTARMLVRFGEWTCRHWDLPDEGIWEPRYGRRHHTHSKAMCAVALRALLELHQQGHARRLPVERFRANLDLIVSAIETRGWNERLRSYVQTLDGDRLDAALLTLPLNELVAPTSPRVCATLKRVRERLSPREGLLYRYEQSVGVEGCFIICAFWLVEVLAMGAGTLDDATRVFEAACGYANDLGLLSEEVDPSTGELLGNFPQGFSHVGLINAALRLEEREKHERAGAVPAWVPPPRGREQQGVRL